MNTMLAPLTCVDDHMTVVIYPRQSLVGQNAESLL